ncbi:MAG: hypothetical protein LBH53_01820 [Puniceicoccales bacterium]|nr:hypothetical protein [Puniceicoccales bacterium]
MIGSELRKIGGEDKKRSFSEKVTCQGTEVKVHRPSEALFWTVVDNVYANRPMREVKWMLDGCYDYCTSRDAVDEFNKNWMPDCPYLLRISLNPGNTPTREQWEAFTKKMEELKETVQELVSYCDKRAAEDNGDCELAAFNSALKKFQTIS